MVMTLLTTRMKNSLTSTGPELLAASTTAVIVSVDDKDEGSTESELPAAESTLPAEETTASSLALTIRTKQAPSQCQRFRLPSRKS
ncbi:hypothetical protein HanPSC8_Chr01g0036421 [Helianthus annuus]|nr:hypothetical protein HanIR_Chr01g0041751 [Helianthus annuus]KAJ0784414.1 hypothetical protein HanLR1_Chr01g0031821 [Helianthus annuus]KAJ0958207.1 hypothetical protein HanPSC8_Chr01g0036421 [Helianthus annuus]